MIPRAQALASCVFSCPPRRQMVGPDNLPFELNLTEFLMRSLRCCTAIEKDTHHVWGDDAAYAARPAILQNPIS